MEWLLVLILSSNSGKSSMVTHVVSDVDECRLVYKAFKANVPPSLIADFTCVRLKKIKK